MRIISSASPRNKFPTKQSLKQPILGKPIDTFDYFFDMGEWNIYQQFPIFAVETLLPVTCIVYFSFLWLGAGPGPDQAGLAFLEMQDAARPTEDVQERKA